MGEIIKVFSKLPNGFEIELNAPQTEGQDFIVHIQNEHGRLSLSRDEFIQLAMLFFSAEYNLKTYKDFKLDEDK